jgi:hypothetical protein
MAYSSLLEIGGKTYDTDPDGTIAAVGAGDNPFLP